MDLVYGEINDGLVFIPRDQALELARLREALGTATWADLKAGVSPERWREIVSRMTDGDEADMPAPDEDLSDGLLIPGLADGDWPTWPAQAMLEWMPQQLIWSYGEVRDSVLNGSFLWLDPNSLEGILDDFQEIGWQCEEDEVLVLTASGYG